MVPMNPTRVRNVSGFGSQGTRKEVCSGFERQGTRKEGCSGFERQGTQQPDMLRPTSLTPMLLQECQQELQYLHQEWKSERCEGLELPWTWRLG